MDGLRLHRVSGERLCGGDPYAEAVIRAFCHGVQQKSGLCGGIENGTLILMRLERQSRKHTAYHNSVVCPHEEMRPHQAEGFKERASLHKERYRC